jgi:hypothetical protein
MLLEVRADQDLIRHLVKISTRLHVMAICPFLLSSMMSPGEVPRGISSKLVTTVVGLNSLDPHCVRARLQDACTEQREYAVLATIHSRVAPDIHLSLLFLMRKTSGEFVVFATFNDQKQMHVKYDAVCEPT